ncbi:Uncharacterised protein [Capnocytophaga sputigena]|nr:Uncharacterised protein [Capnocytophaga sputigena]
MEEIILLELSKQIRDQGYDATPDLPNLMIRIGDKMFCSTYKKRICNRVLVKQ